MNTKEIQQISLSRAKNGKLLLLFLIYRLKMFDTRHTHTQILRGRKNERVVERIGETGGGDGRVQKRLWITARKMMYWANECTLFSLSLNGFFCDNIVRTNDISMLEFQCLFVLKGNSYLKLVLRLHFEIFFHRVLINESNDLNA